MNKQLSPPPPRAILWELTAAREPVRLLLRAAASTTSDSHVVRHVMTIPGVGATDRWMAPMRRHLKSLGHFPMGWGLGRNGDRPDDRYPEVADRVRQLAENVGDTIDIVGWSIGGVIAREVARDLPGSVGRVFTLGTPVVDGPRFTRGGGRYPQVRLDEISSLIADRERMPIEVPVTAIFSKRDGVVAWEACIDPFDNNVRHVEVKSSHLGMTLDPDVWKTIARGLEAQA